MRYVMVPVPSEFVLDVMRMVLFRAPDDNSSPMGDEIRLQQVMDDSSPMARSLIAMVANAAAEGRPLRFSDVAEELALDPDVLGATMRDINSVALGTKRDLIAASEEIAVRVHGNVGSSRYLIMRPEHARIIRRIARSYGPPASPTEIDQEAADGDVSGRAGRSGLDDL